IPYREKSSRRPRGGTSMTQVVSARCVRRVNHATLTGTAFALDSGRRLVMSQDDQNRERQNQDEGYQDQQDETPREGRSDSPSDPEQVNRGSESPDRSSESEADDMDEDRDDDLRGDG